MNKITTLDSSALQNLRAPIEAELAALAERLGLSLKLGGGKYSDGVEASFQLVLKVENPAVKTAAAKAAWDRNCHFIGVDYVRPDLTGLRPEDFGATFAYAGTVFRAAGIALKGKGCQKFPILAEAISGKHPAGKTMMLPETAVPMIRASTDAAKAAA